LSSTKNTNKLVVTKHVAWVLHILKCSSNLLAEFENRFAQEGKKEKNRKAGKGEERKGKEKRVEISYLLSLQLLNPGYATVLVAEMTYCVWSGTLNSTH